MKHSIRITISALLLSLSVLNLAANVKENYNGGKDVPPVVSPDIIVTVDDKGQADGGHHFQEIDDTNFYIDDIKYTAKQGDLVVSGYNDAFFKGAAAIITALKYQGRTMNVTNIQNESFKNCKVITSCIIGNRVTNIGECAFENCRDLTSVTIPNSVTTIGKRTFAGCWELTSVTIPNSVTSIGEAVFSGCKGLTSVTVEKGNSVYDSRDNCNAIINTATNTLIVGCKNTTIPNNVTSIGELAFGGCTGLTSVNIPKSVTSIGEMVFSGCKGLTSVTVEKGNSVYDSRDNCNAIINTVTNTLIVGCKNTTIPSSVTSIGEQAFILCIGLTSVTIPSNVTSIGAYAFMNCSDLTSVTIPSSVTSIGSGAFMKCSGLTSVTIPSSVTSIGSGAFMKCSGLTSVTVENGNGIYDSRDNCNAIINTATNALIAGCKNTTIPSSVTCIGAGAFADCKSLTSVTIPNSVTSIGEMAFYDCI